MVPNSLERSSQRPDCAVRSTNRTPGKFHQFQCHFSTLHWGRWFSYKYVKILDLDPWLTSGKNQEEAGGFSAAVKPPLFFLSIVKKPTKGKWNIFLFLDVVLQIGRRKCNRKLIFTWELLSVLAKRTNSSRYLWDLWFIFTFLTEESSYKSYVLFLICALGYLNTTKMGYLLQVLCIRCCSLLC